MTRKFEGEGTINGPGTGTIVVQKLELAGDAAGAVPDRTVFIVLAGYELDGQFVSTEIELTNTAGPVTTTPPTTPPTEPTEPTAPTKPATPTQPTQPPGKGDNLATTVRTSRRWPAWQPGCCSRASPSC